MRAAVKIGVSTLLVLSACVDLRAVKNRCRAAPDCAAGFVCQAGICIDANGGFYDGPRAAPAGVQASLEGDAVRLAWQVTPGAIGYVVLRRAGDADPFEQIANTSAVSYSDAQIWNRCETFAYAVSAVYPGAVFGPPSAAVNASPHSELACLNVARRGDGWRGLATAGGAAITWGPRQRVRRSTDGGASWGEATTEPSLPSRAGVLLFGQNLYAAAGDEVAISVDGGAHFTAPVKIPPPPPTQTFDATGLAEGNGRLVAIDAAGAVAVSTAGGRSWQSFVTNASAGLGAVAFGNGVFVTAGAGGVIMISGDGAYWQPVSSPTTATITAVAFGRHAGVAGFMAVAADGAVLWSSDAEVKQWSNVAALGPLDAPRLAALSDGFVIVTGDAFAYLSVDGFTPTALPVRGRVRAFAAEGTAVIAAGDGDLILRSGDARTWAAASLDADWNAIASSPELFAAAGAGGTLATSGDGGGTWQIARVDQQVIWRAVAADNAGSFVVVGDGGRAAKWSGSQWQSSATPAAKTLRAVASNGFMWVAVGDDEAIVSSLDGISWQARGAGTGSGTGASFVGVTFGRAEWLAMSRAGEISTSVGGVIWTPAVKAVSGVTLRGVRFARGRFIAYGDDRVVLVSEDGANWALKRTGLTGNVVAAIDTGAAWVVADETSLAVSRDGGETWSPTRLLADPSDIVIRGLGFSQRLVVVGADGLVVR